MAVHKTQAATLLSTPEDTEAQFYDALQHGDLERLMAVWADDDEVSCVHPGGPRLVGLNAVRAAFEAVLAQGAVDAQIEHVRSFHHGDTCIHNVLERVQVMGPRGPQSAWVIATNVYVKTALGWRMVLHHASPGSAEHTQELIGAPAVLH